MSVDAIDLLCIPYVLTPPHSTHTHAPSLSTAVFNTPTLPRGRISLCGTWERLILHCLSCLRNTRALFLYVVFLRALKACGRTPENTGEWGLFVLLSGLQAVTVNRFECSKKENALNWLVWCVPCVSSWSYTTLRPFKSCVPEDDAHRVPQVWHICWRNCQCCVFEIAGMRVCSLVFTEMTLKERCWHQNAN